MGLVDKAFLDKLRESAQQAVQQAQDGMAQGQAKLDAFQLKRQADALLRDLGAAHYAEHRGGASPQPVASALAALDAHVARHGPLHTEEPSPAAEPAPPPPPPPDSANASRTEPSPGPNTPGNYSLDDV